MDTLTSMRAFLRVVQAGGFAKAAKRLGLSPAMVTKHVNALEQRLGVRLLHRTTRRLALTDAGAEYYEHCARLIADLEAAEQSIGAAAVTPGGRLRIAAGAALDEELAPLLVGYMRRERGVMPEVVLENRFVDLVEEGFDVAIRGALKLAESSLVVRPLARSELVLCASPEYVAGGRGPRSPEDLAQHAFLPLMHPLLKNELGFRRDGERRTVPLVPALRSNSVRVLREACAAGAGVLLAPSMNAWRDLAAGRLVRILADWRIGSVGLHALYPHRRHLPAKVRSFVDYVAEALGGDATRDPWLERVAMAAAAPARGRR
jgi:DNA-binding transcriptional LysR family regulator